MITTLIFFLQIVHFSSQIPFFLYSASSNRKCFQTSLWCKKKFQYMHWSSGVGNSKVWETPIFKVKIQVSKPTKIRRSKMSMQISVEKIFPSMLQRKLWLFLFHAGRKLWSILSCKVKITKIVIATVNFQTKFVQIFNLIFSKIWLKI